MDREREHERDRIKERDRLLKADLEGSASDAEEDSWRRKLYAGRSACCSCSISEYVLCS